MFTLFATIDDAWLPYACMMVESVRRNSTDKISLTILHQNIENSRAIESRLWANRRGIRMDFVHLADIGVELPPAPFGVSPAVCWGRYLAPLIFPTQIKRVLYIDVDIICVGPIKDLFEVDLLDKSVGAVNFADEIAANDIGIHSGDYCNNGLLLLDTRKFNGMACIRLMNTALQSRPLRYGFQCAFNVACSHDIAKLDPKWNVQGHQRCRPPRDARIIHFTGDTKPWSVMSLDPLRAQVKELLASTPFPEAWEYDRAASKIVRRFVRTLKRILLSEGRAG